MGSNEDIAKKASGHLGDDSPKSTIANDVCSDTHLRPSDAQKPSDTQTSIDSQKSSDVQKPGDAQKPGDTPKISDAQQTSDTKNPGDAQQTSDEQELSDVKGKDGVGKEGRDASVTLAGSAVGERGGRVDITGDEEPTVSDGQAVSRDGDNTKDGETSAKKGSAEPGFETCSSDHRDGVVDTGNGDVQETREEERAVGICDGREGSPADFEGFEAEKKGSSGGDEQKGAEQDGGVVKDADKPGDGEDDRRELVSADGAVVVSTGEPPFAKASRESSGVSEEDLDDMNKDLDQPWVKPSLEHALQARKRAIWNHGLRSYFGTTVKEIGSMGVGMYMYFWMARIVALAFLLCAFVSLPALILNNEGNAGMAISETDVDSLGLVSLSYGNQGLNPSLVVESGCISSNGTVDCTGQTVQVFGEAKDALQVGYILVGVEIVIAISFAAFIMILSDKLEAKIEEIDESNVSPADYAVMVRGLPTDVTKEEVREHFHSRYSLTAPDPSYPFLGVSTTGVAVFWASTLGVATGVLVTPSVVARAGVEGRLVVAAVGLGCFSMIVFSVFAVSRVCGVGGPRKRDTPQEKWEKRTKKRRRRKALENKKTASAALKNATVSTVVPSERDAEATAAVEENRDAPGMLEAGGVPAGNLNRTSAEGRPPDPVPCQSCLNTHDKSFLGSWVADVVLGNPLGDVLQGFMDQEEAFAEIRKARVVVRQMKTLGKAKKLAKAESKLAKLKTKEEALMAKTKKKQDPAKLDIISVAFVTFEQEESKRRCLEDYRYSRSAFGRYFQPTRLQFCPLPEPDDAEGEDTEPSRCGRSNSKKPLAQRWRLKVSQAPEPSDVKWENLDVTPTSRKLRKTMTSFVCTVLLIVSFAIIYLAQNEQTKLAQRIPTLDTCAETIPAVIFGTYDFPLDAELMRDKTRDSTCPEGSFYLAYFTNSSNHDSGATVLNYTSLPRVYSADGGSVSRAEFELDNGASSLCDDPCSPTSGGTTCRALSCFEKSWRSEGFDCSIYPQSTTVGCFCLDAVVTSLKDNGLIAGARVVAREQGAVCAPFLTDYAQANALNVLAVLSVVVVNTLLTSVMGKLAKFERHVSLSDFTSTFTAKLALGQFLNTALVVIIVNAGYTGGGLGFLQDMGVLGGEYKDFERAWYATVGVAVAMTMLLNVVVPHVGPLVDELIVKRIMRFVMRRSIATQEELDDLYKPPKFSMESRYAFLLQVLGVSMLYSGGIPILYIFAAFSFATNFVVDKLWIVKLTRQPPMYTAALARMFVWVMPLALLVHMALACYMLGNPDILNIGFVSQEAEAIATDLQGEGLLGLAADHALRKHVFALFVLTVVFFALFLAYNIVGDPLLKLLKIVFGTLFRYILGYILRHLLRLICKRTPKKSVTAELHQQPGFTGEYFRVLARGEKIEADEKAMGWVVTEDGKKAKWLFTDDGNGPRGVKARKGVPRQTWQAIAELGQYNYVMEESDACGLAARYMATAGFLSPRMKEKNKLRKAKTEKAAVKEEAEKVRVAQEASNGVAAVDAGIPTAALCAAASRHPPGPPPQERKSATANEGDNRKGPETVSGDRAHSAPDGQKRDDGAPAKGAAPKADDGKMLGLVSEEQVPSAPNGDKRDDDRSAEGAASIDCERKGPGVFSGDQVPSAPGGDKRDSDTCMPADAASLSKEGDRKGAGAVSGDEGPNPPGGDRQDERPANNNTAAAPKCVDCSGGGEDSTTALPEQDAPKKREGEGEDAIPSADVREKKSLLLPSGDSAAESGGKTDRSEEAEPR